MINYILGVDEQAGVPRLLLEKDGSLTILVYDKQINILSTNVVGFMIGAYGYLELRLSLYQDPKNTLKKIPKIVAGVGTVLGLGFQKSKISVLDYAK